MTMLTLSKTLLLTSFLLPATAYAVEDFPALDQVALMSVAKKSDLVGTATKTKEVDARPALPGEIVITFIKGQGVEKRSKPAEEGDWVVRNRCEETGNEEVLVKARYFPKSYGEPVSPSTVSGYMAFKPKSGEMNYFIVPEEWGAFNFKAPTGDTMLAMPGDAIVQVSSDEAETYRVAGPAFECTYDVVVPAKMVTALR
ncbi:hypothetical protein [Agrobacterium larrymoorei]|uniref:hypothetical protein n=1 Tax=Agrobacterium larrymoorei TaxID=160699 RepID=UPI00191F1923|nr:hypothetical protein [Agrobacterium larrymoorei]